MKATKRPSEDRVGQSDSSLGSSPLLVHRCEATRAIAAGGPVDPALIEALASCGAPVDAAVLAAHAHRRGAGRRSVAREAVRRRRSVPEVRLPLLAALDRPELTPREHEIVRLTAEGRTTAEVARVAGCSVRTVENHLHRAYQKLGISGRADLAEFLGGS